MEHPVLTAIRQAAFTPLGWFAPCAGDRVPGDARFVILIGNAGPHMFQRFARERNPQVDKIDDWTREAAESLARNLDADIAYPFDTDPPHPFLTWARRGGAGYVSPLGLNIHPTYGLWHAYRAALLFPVEFDIPGQTSQVHPCDVCQTKPCLSTCPVSAFSGTHFDLATCASHLKTPAGENCMARGCLARLACPVGQGFAYAPAQAQFHMRAFRAAH
jgi:epoxyqueuosine reductase QueG